MTNGLLSDLDTFHEFCAVHRVLPDAREFLLAELRTSARNLENLRILDAKRGDRQAVLGRYDEIMVVLEKLSSGLGPAMPTNLRSALNRLWCEPAETFASNSAIAKFAPELRNDREPRSRREIEMERERPGQAARRNAEIRHEALQGCSVDVIRIFVDDLLSSMRGPREFERQARRGGDPDVRKRTMVIKHLAPIYEAVTQRTATGSPKSEFVVFLDPILQELDLPVTGLATAVGRALRQMHRKKNKAPDNRD